jgi:hypothetical protein
MMDKKIDLYIATPYSAHGKEKKIIQEMRFREVTKIAGWIMKQGYTVLSPITHGHPIALVTRNMPTDYNFWKETCEAQMDSCKIICLYEQDGWASSEGWLREFKYAESKGQPVMTFKSRLDFKNRIKSKMDEYNEWIEKI